VYPLSNGKISNGNLKKFNLKTFIFIFIFGFRRFLKSNNLQLKGALQIFLRNFIKLYLIINQEHLLQHHRPFVVYKIEAIEISCRVSDQFSFQQEKEIR